MLTPLALLAVYAAGTVLFFVGAATAQTFVLAAGVVLVASGIAIQSGGAER